MASAFDAWQVELHGHRVIYRVAGSGPPVVLIHGMVNSPATGRRSRCGSRIATR